MKFTTTKRSGNGFPKPKTSGRYRAAVFIESLEARTLLSANIFFKPTFIVSPTSAPGTIVPNSLSSPFKPSQILTAYGLNGITFGGSISANGAGQTIAIVDAYCDPSIVADVDHFNTSFTLQRFNVTGGPTFKVENQTGGTSLPDNSSPGDWDIEQSLDVEWAHVIAPMANIVLIEANDNMFSNLLSIAEVTASKIANVSVISNSWGTTEFSTETNDDSIFHAPTGHNGETFVFSTGDNGSPGEYPAYAPGVLSVGGTSLTINNDGTYGGETGWTDSGGGISQYEAQPSYQTGKVHGLSSTHRTTPDVSWDADQNTGVYIYDSYAGGNGWFRAGGTSLAAPMWSGLIAVVDQGRVALGKGTMDGLTQTLPMIYNLPPTAFHDIIGGNNGFAATTGYDLVTGRGTPIASVLIPDMVGTPSHLVFHVQPGTTIAGVAINPSVIVYIEDSTNQIVTTDDTNVTITVHSGPGTLNVSLAAHNGIATFSNDLILTKAGSYALSAADGSDTAAISSTFTVSPAAAAKLVFLTQPTSTVAGKSISPAIVVAIEDTFGNIVTGNTSQVTIGVKTGPGAVLGTDNANASAGKATFGAVNLQKTGTYSLTATDGTLTAATSTSFNVSAAAVAHLAFVQQPTNAVAGTTVAPGMTVVATDAYGNVVSNSTVAMAVSVGPGGLFGTLTAVTNSSGVATFSNLILHTVGGYRLSASVGSVKTATSNAFTITAGAVASLTFVQPPTNSLAGNSISPAVTVKALDAYGNVVVNTTITISRASGPGTIFGTLTAATNASGIATFSTLSFRKSGNYTLAATDGSVKSAASSSFTVSAAAASKLIFTTIPTSQSNTVKVTVVDAYGNVLVTDNTGTISLALATHPTGSTLDGTTTESLVNGVATFTNISFSIAGTYSLTATDSFGVVSATSAAFAIS